jgi:hypothetical protein
MHYQERGPEKARGRNAGWTAPRPLNTASLLAGAEGSFTSTEVREAQLWAEAIARSVEAWRHRENRRREGGRP